MYYQAKQVNAVRRLKLLKSCKYGKSGEVLYIDNNEAFGLIDSGFAELTKDMTPDDYKQAGDKDGSNTQLRTHKSK